MTEKKGRLPVLCETLECESQVKLNNTICNNCYTKELYSYANEQFKGCLSQDITPRQHLSEFDLRRT